jgi:hypothetical protein
MDTNTLAVLLATHELYCQLTGEKLSSRFDRERLWYEFLRAGFSAQDLKRVVTCLQKEIRVSRRNIGALKLSNLLQLDRFEEDLNISNVRLRSAPPPQSPRSTPSDPSPPTPAQFQNLRQEAKAVFSRLKRAGNKFRCRPLPRSRNPEFVCPSSAASLQQARRHTGRLCN